MKPIAARWCATLILLTIATTARAQDETKKAIETQYTLFAADLQAKRTESFHKAALPDAKGIDLLGKELPRDKWLASLTDRVAKIEMLKVTSEVREVSTKDNEATSIAQFKATGETAGTDGKQVPIEMNFIDRTTWTKQDGGWKIKLSKLVMMDGKLNNRTIRNTFTPEADAAKKDIQAYYDAISDLYAKKDFDTLSKAATGAEVDIQDASGNKLTGAELANRVKTGAKDITDPIMTINVQMAEMNDKTATVVRVMRLLGDIKLPDGMNHRMRYVQVARDKWVKQKKGWANKASYELYSEAALDGKLVPLSQIGGK